MEKIQIENGKLILNFPNFFGKFDFDVEQTDIDSLLAEFVQLGVISLREAMEMAAKAKSILATIGFINKAKNS